MKRICQILLAVLIAIALGGPSLVQMLKAGNIYNALSCSQSDVQDIFNQVVSENVAGSTVNIPAAVGGDGKCHWTTHVDTGTLPPNITVRGHNADTSDSVRGNSGDTVIVDDLMGSDGGSPLFDVAFNSGDLDGAPSRFYGITFEGGTGNRGKIPIIGIVGSHAWRWDHVTLNKQTYSSSPGNAWLYRIYNDAWGVMDHDVFKQDGNDNGIGILGPGQGDTPWSQATQRGTKQNVFVETSTFYTTNDGSAVHGSGNDCKQGGNQVFRNNIMGGDSNGTTSLQTHPTGGSGPRSRGCRDSEFYRNLFSGNNSFPGFNNIFLSSGAALVWGNSSPAGAEKFLSLRSMRRYKTTYYEGQQPVGWGYAGPAYQTGTGATTTSSGKTVTGTGFSTSWVVPFVMHIEGSDCHAKPDLLDPTNFVSGDCTVKTVNSSTSITLGNETGDPGDDNDPGDHTGLTWTVGSYADENSNVNNGNRALDQPGNGQGDLITGLRALDGGSGATLVKNSATGKFSDENGFWPNQALEPIYEWKNTHACSGCSNVFFTSLDDIFQADYNYYLHKGMDDPDSDTDTENTSCPTGSTCTPFNGTSGTGWGLRSLRPTSGMVNGVAYWSKDFGGNWDTSTGNVDANDGCLDIVESGSWHDCWYTPFPYPHYLAAGTQAVVYNGRSAFQIFFLLMMAIAGLSRMGIPPFAVRQTARTKILIRK